jgi:hypothetical protein
MTTVALDDIRAARQRAAGVVRVTPLEPSATFSSLCGRQIYLKLENLQKTAWRSSISCPMSTRSSCPSAAAACSPRAGGFARRGGDADR